MVMEAGIKKWVALKVLVYFAGSFLISFGAFFYMNQNDFNPVDYILKPFLLVPIALLGIKLCFITAAHTFRLILVFLANRVLRFLGTAFILTFAIYDISSFYYFKIAFNPADYILKPFMLLPVSWLMLPLLAEAAGKVLHYMKLLRLKIDHTSGRLSLKLIEKPLPIYIVSKDQLSEIRMNGTIVDMRIKDQGLLFLAQEAELVKLHPPHGNIANLAAKANQIIQNTAMKNIPITFVVDSKKDRSRTISKIWLRLIRNPNSRSARTDIDTILQLVY